MKTYREIIRENIREVVQRKSKDKGNEKYWDWVLQNLVLDLRDYEGRGRWPREPFDRAWQRYRTVSTGFPDVDELIRRFFDDYF